MTEVDLAYYYLPEFALTFVLVFFSIGFYIRLKFGSFQELITLLEKYFETKEIAEKVLTKGVQMKNEDILKLARETEVFEELIKESFLIKFAHMVAEHERELIAQEWWLCYQSDLENGVKSLNEYEAKKFATSYPEMAKFGEFLDKRSEA